ncbi:MAG: FAD-dependent oxidoreductase [Candidatus Nitricoxidivorans perseverans]|uniref:FAD-dependent oxidoreductase n=1 Tax=Candidatus Nitricoxidivorans perseverans TaxID=2975601 RepID=A0AA49IXG7_9PROT|nr:MAG: FAD-dependent oxidoreductase [Candidatus Nitricoxidivorans perseverans]
MHSFDRRSFIKTLSAAAGASILTVPQSRAATPKARVVVVGGGYGGATAARYLRLLDPGIEVTLIERGTLYTSCPLSNEVISGVRDIKTLQAGYGGLGRRGVKVVHNEVTQIDPVKKAVTTADGNVFAYDALVVSPGVDFNYPAIQGLTQEISENQIPHAWKAGPQTLLLKKQLEAMPDGGRFIIAVPKAPFRCPPGPYERAAQVAMHCLHHGKKKAKVLILDSNDAFSKKPLFEQAWKTLYGYGEGGMIEWVPGAKGGIVEGVDAGAMTCLTTFDQHKGDVINIIPPHRAGKIAIDAGLANFKGAWCAVKPENMESTAHNDIYVIGDSCVGGELATGNPFPKSAHMAGSQAKIVAASLVAKLNGLPPPKPIYTNACYSVAGHDWGFSVVVLFRVENNQWVYVKEGSGISPVTFGTKEKPIPVPRAYRKMEAEYADGWLRNILADAFS